MRINIKTNLSWRMLLLFFTLFVSVGAIFVLNNLGYDESYKEFLESVNRLTEKGKIFSFLLFFVFYFFITVFVFWFPVWPLTVVGGALFGPWWGGFYSILSATLGALGAFKLSRYIEGGYFMNLINRKTEKIRHLNDSIEKRGFFVIFILRLIHIVPFRGLNYLAGVTNISVKDFFWGTFFGIIPATLFYAFLGSALISFEIFNIIMALSFITAFSAIIFWFQRDIFKKDPRSGSGALSANAKY